MIATWLLIGVYHTHTWINGVNTFVKVCEYVHAEAKTPRERYLNRKAFYIHPDLVCPRSMK